MSDTPKRPRAIFQNVTVTGCGHGGEGGGLRIGGMDADITDSHFENNRVDIEATDGSIRVTDTQFIDKPQRKSRTSVGWGPGFRMPWLDKKDS